jgi:hypothetical protein
MKDNMGLETSGVYSIPYEYGQPYIGQTSCSIETRVKEHPWYIFLENLDKSCLENTASAWAVDSNYRTQA